MLKLHLMKLIFVLRNDIKFLYYIITGGLQWQVQNCDFIMTSIPAVPTLCLHCHSNECPAFRKISEVSIEEEGWQNCSCPKRFQDELVKIAWSDYDDIMPQSETLCYVIDCPSWGDIWFDFYQCESSFHYPCRWGVCICLVLWTNSLNVVTNGKKQWQIT